MLDKINNNKITIPGIEKKIEHTNNNKSKYKTAKTTTQLYLINNNKIN